MIAARIPVANLAAANASLEGQGFGPRNFSVPVYTGAVPQFAALHAWGSNLGPFYAAVKALPGVVWSEAAGEPQTRVDAVLAGIQAKWAGSAQPLTGVVTPGLYVDAQGVFWWVIQQYDTAVFPDPTLLPALIRRARVPGAVQPWVQPLDANDAYWLVNPFTGAPDRVTHNGQTWRVSQQSAAGGINTFEPGVFGWVIDG